MYRTKQKFDHLNDPFTYLHTHKAQNHTIKVCEVCVWRWKCFTMPAPWHMTDNDYDMITHDEMVCVWPGHCAQFVIKLEIVVTLSHVTWTTHGLSHEFLYKYPHEHMQ